MEKKKKLSLPVQIFIALVLGIVVGLVFYFTGAAGFTTSYIKPFGDIFVNLLKFIVVPVVLLSMIDGIISMGDMKKVGAVGWKTILYFMVTTAVACIIGLVLATVFNNAGLFPNLSEAAQAAEYEAKEYAGFMATLVAIFPTNMWKAFTEANMLQVIVIALLFGGSILAAGEKSKLVRDMVTSAYAVVERLMEFIISLSPIGVFTYMTWVVATQGAEILGSLALVILCAYIGYILHALLVYSVSAKAFAGISPVKFFKNASAAMIFAFTSTSSAATLPVSKECADALGAEDDISSFVLPLGATINMDGTAIYQCVATVFLATCAGMQLTLSQMILIVVTATLASIGTAGTPGTGMIILMPIHIQGTRYNLLQLSNPQPRGTVTLRREDHIAHLHEEFIGRARTVSMNCYEIVHSFIGGFLRGLDSFQDTHECSDGIADLDVHELHLLVQRLFKLRIDQSELFLKILHIHAILVFGANGVPQWNNTALGTNQKNRIEICAAHTHIGGGKAQRRNHFLGLQAFGSNLPMICIEKIVCLPIQTPDCCRNGVIEVGCHKSVSGITRLRKSLVALNRGSISITV